MQSRLSDWSHDQLMCSREKSYRCGALGVGSPCQRIPHLLPITMRCGLKMWIRFAHVIPTKGFFDRGEVFVDVRVIEVRVAGFVRGEDRAPARGFVLRRELVARRERRDAHAAVSEARGRERGRADGLGFHGEAPEESERRAGAESGRNLALERENALARPAQG